MPIRSWQDLINDAGGAGDSYDPIPPGDYDFVISEAEATQSQSGKTMYKVRCKVESGPHAERLVFHNFTLSPENPVALSIFFRQMNVLGMGREFFGSNPSDHHVAEELKGKRFRGQVQIRTYQGQEKNEIKQLYTAVQGVMGNGASIPSPSAAPPAPAPAAAAPSAPPAAPAPAPQPEYQAPAAPTPAPAPAPPAAPAPAPVEQPTPPPVETPAAPPAAPPAPAPAPAAATPNVPAPPPF